MPCKWARIPFTLQNMQIPLAHLCSILRSFDHDEKGRLTKIVLRYRLQSIGLLICTLIYENQGLEKSRSASNLFQVLDKLCSVCILFEESVFIFQFLNDKIYNYVLFDLVVNFEN